jgi:hypothetical protein
MKCKVLSASLERDGKIYKQGEYIEIVSEKDAERLSSFGCILLEKAKKVMEQPKMPDTGVVRGKKKEVTKK